MEEMLGRTCGATGVAVMKFTIECDTARMGSFAK